MTRTAQCVVAVSLAMLWISPAEAQSRSGARAAPVAPVAPSPIVSRSTAGATAQANRAGRPAMNRGPRETPVKNRVLPRRGLLPGKHPGTTMR